MFSILMTLFTALLFVVLTPGVILTIPAKGSALTAAFVHGLLFAFLYHVTHKAVWHMIHGDKKVEGFAACTNGDHTGCTCSAAKKNGTCWPGKVCKTIGSSTYCG